MELTLNQIKQMEKVDDLMLETNQNNRQENAQKAAKILFSLGFIKHEDGGEAVKFYQKYVFEKLRDLAHQHEQEKR